MNIKLAKHIEKTTKDLQNYINETLDNFLNKIDGYNKLNEDSKAICKIFFCIDLLYKIAKYEKTI